MLTEKKKKQQIVMTVTLKYWNKKELFISGKQTGKFDHSHLCHISSAGVLIFPGHIPWPLAVFSVKDKDIFMWESGMSDLVFANCE